jgi:hypothetical protein
VDVVLREELLRIDALVRVDVLLHELDESLLQVSRSRAVLEVHVPS